MITRDSRDMRNSARASFSVRLIGEMWWDDASDRVPLQEFVLFADRLSFAVEADGSRYQGTLEHLDGKNYKGTFSFSLGGTGIAWCRLVLADGEYQLDGKWRQSGINHLFDWNAVLEPLRPRPQSAIRGPFRG